MRFFFSCLLAAALAATAAADVAEKYRGDWLLVNGATLLHVDADGTMTLRPANLTGKVTIADDGTFTWSVPAAPQRGRFANDRLLLKNDQPGVPQWMEYLEFRRGTKEQTSELAQFAARQQAQTMKTLADIRRSSMEKAILNNLRQLAAASDQFFLENGVNKVRLEQIVGPDKYIRKLTPVDGEDYGKLDLTQGVPFKIVSASGITVSYER